MQAKDNKINEWSWTEAQGYLSLNTDD